MQKCNNIFLDNCREHPGHKTEMINLLTNLPSILPPVAPKFLHIFPINRRPSTLRFVCHKYAIWFCNADRGGKKEEKENTSGKSYWHVPHQTADSIMDVGEP